MAWQERELLNRKKCASLPKSNKTRLELENWNVWNIFSSNQFQPSYDFFSVYFFTSTRIVSYLHVFPQRWWMRVRFIATWNSTVVRFVRSVYVWMFLPIWWISEATIASFMFTFERLLTCKTRNEKENIRIGLKIYIKLKMNFKFSLKFICLCLSAMPATLCSTQSRKFPYFTAITRWW